MQKNSNICLVSFLFHDAFIPAFSNLQEILFSISDNFTQIISVTPNFPNIDLKGSKNLHLIVHKTSENFIIRIFRYVLLNFNISVKIFLTKNNYDSIVFFCEQGLFLPMIVAKLCKKKIYWLLPSSFHKMRSYNPDPLIKCLFYYHECSLIIADFIVLYSSRLISEWNLEKFSHKILIGPLHTVNNDTFNVTISFSDRPFIVGYVGRLSIEKGVQNFVQAIPTILNDRTGFLVCIVGDGPLKESIKESLQAEKLKDYIKLHDWISHDNLSYYLNNFRLLVIPSYTEGGPLIMVEALACGTPVLATPVGSVTDVIKDGETGFIMKDNSPACIAENVIRALSSPDLDRIAENGRLFALKNFTFENSCKRWKRILDET